MCNNNPLMKTIVFPFSCAAGKPDLNGGFVLSSFFARLLVYFPILAVYTWHINTNEATQASCTPPVTK